MNGKILSLGVTCALLLPGCGGGSSTPASDSGPDDTVLIGVFVDSPVEGATYATQTQSGTTNASGEFSYLANEQVVFSIGATQLPAVAATAQVTPLDISAGSGNPIAMTTNIARLLQSLDQDGNPENGITIPTTAAATAAILNFDVSTDEFANDSAVINLVANSGSVTTSLISAEAANEHLNTTLGTTSQVNNDGLWIRNSASSTESGLADYSSVDGLNITRYNSSTTGCYTVSTNTATLLENNRYQLAADNGPVFFTLNRVGETLEVTFDGEPTLIYPRANGIDTTALPLCSAASAFAVDDLISGSPWYSIRVYGEGVQLPECAGIYSFNQSGILNGAAGGTNITGSYSLSDTGILRINTTEFGVEDWQLNSLGSSEWSTNKTNNDGLDYLERVFSSRDAALALSGSLGTDCNAGLPL